MVSNPSINVEEEAFITHLKKFNIINAKRIIKKHSNTILPLVKAETFNLESFNKVLNEGKNSVTLSIDVINGNTVLSPFNATIVMDLTAQLITVNLPENA